MKINAVRCDQCGTIRKSMGSMDISWLDKEVKRLDMCDEICMKLWLEKINLMIDVIEGKQND